MDRVVLEFTGGGGGQRGCYWPTMQKTVATTDRDSAYNVIGAWV